MAITNRTLGLAIAGGALASALLDGLYRKDLLSLDEAREVLESASKILNETRSTSDGVVEAKGIMAAMMLGRFSERR
jgi:hypothetical protein